MQASSPAQTGSSQSARPLPSSSPTVAQSSSGVTGTERVSSQPPRLGMMVWALRVTALRTGWPAPRQPSAKKTLATWLSPSAPGNSLATLIMAMVSEPLGSSVIGLTNERTTALTAPRRPSQPLPPPGVTPERSVVSDFSKPTLRIPPWATSAPTVPSVVILRISAPSAAILIDQPWAPSSRSLFEVVRTQPKSPAIAAPAGPSIVAPQGASMPSSDKATSWAIHCPTNIKLATTAQVRTILVMSPSVHY